MVDYYNHLALGRKVLKREEEYSEKTRERERLIEESVNWPEYSEAGYTEMLTLWGAALKVSKLMRKSGRDAREDALDERLPRIKKAIKDGQLDARDMNTLEVERTAYNNGDFIEVIKFNNWLKLKYSFLLQDAKGDCEQSELSNKPVPLSGFPETQIAWMLYVLRVEEKQIPNTPIRRGLLKELIDIAASLEHPIGESTIKRNWSVALKRFNNDTD